MFHLDLFRIRAFACGNLSLFLSSIAREGLQFMLIIWLQGIWLPLHGYSYESTPLWSGIYMLPMMIGFFIMGPLCGRLSDRYGARFFTTGCMVLSVFGLILLALSMTLYFAILIMGLAHNLPPILYSGLVNAGMPAEAAQRIAAMPPTSALFATFLGYNPMGAMIDPNTLGSLSEATKATILGSRFFPQTIAPAVMSSLRLAFYISAVLSALSAVASFLRGKRYVHEEDAAQP
jgi:MFS family permease